MAEEQVAEKGGGLMDKEKKGGEGNTKTHPSDLLPLTRSSF
jgi:hypothetical protein